MRFCELHPDVIADMTEDEREALLIVEEEREEFDRDVQIQLNMKAAAAKFHDK